ncbi:MAG TPA: energy transducer TonB [archaeon]|nr:energy transducer TonB [archaeon]
MNTDLSYGKTMAKKSAFIRKSSVHRVSQNLYLRWAAVWKAMLKSVSNNILIPAYEYLSLSVNHKMYDYFFRRSVVLSVILIFTFNVLLISLQKGRDDADESIQQEMLPLSPRTLVVINAVPRSTLAQRKVKVPEIKEVEIALEEIEIPQPKLGTINIGPDTPVDDGPAGDGMPGGRAASRRPELLMLVPPVYPKDAEKKRIEGSVEMRIHVAVDGTVDQVEITSSSGHSSIDKEAVKAAKKTRFRPAIKNGVKVPMWINYPIQFALPKNKSQ